MAPGRAAAHGVSAPAKLTTRVFFRRGSNSCGPTIPSGRSLPTRDARHGNKEIDPMDFTTRLIIAIGLGALLIGAFILI